MNSATTSQSVQIIGASGKRTTGQVQIKHWDKKARTTRALKFWAAAWAAAVFSVAIPIAHFILVPGLFIAGPVGAWLISTKSSKVTSGEATCPECGENLPIAAASDRWPLQELCTRCQRALTVEKV